MMAGPLPTGQGLEGDFPQMWKILWKK